MHDPEVILIVDDNPENLTVLSGTLEPKGYTVRVAMTGEQAMDSLELAVPDLVLLDIQLPGIDGYEVCRRIRATSDHTALPVVFVSASTLPEHKQLAFESGGDDYIAKPFQAEEVLARVRTHLAAAKYRQHLEDRNVELEQRYRYAFEQAAVGITHVSIDDKRIRDVNHELCEILGYPRDELLGKRIPEITHPDFHEGDRKLFAQLEADDAGQVVREKQYLRKDGTPIWARVTASRVRFGRDSTELSVAYIEDISERKRAEQGLESAMAEIKALNERIQAENVYLQEEILRAYDAKELVGSSQAMDKLRETIRGVARTDTTVLITGETGTGKELVVRALHEASPRSRRPLIKVNCAAVAAGLVESELFGHERGAFTGAVKQRKGRFELADGGSLFLDEVGELSPGTQAKLLRVLEESEFERVGSSKVLKTDVRIFTATNRDLEKEVEAGNFRRDLFYRLNVFPIHVPPLRARDGDARELAEYFLRIFTQRHGRHFAGFDAEALAWIDRYAWPGNVRELRNLVERAAVIAVGPLVALSDFGAIGETAPSPASGATETLQEVQRRHIVAVLERAGWVVEGPQGAANTLGINASTLRSRMKKLGIEKPARGV